MSELTVFIPYFISYDEYPRTQILGAFTTEKKAINFLIDFFIDNTLYLEEDIIIDKDLIQKLKYSNMVGDYIISFKSDEDKKLFRDALYICCQNEVELRDYFDMFGKTQFIDLIWTIGISKKVVM